MKNEANTADFEYKVIGVDLAAIEKSVLKNLTDFTDKKMEAFFKHHREKQDEHYAFQNKHAKQVEKYLANQEKLIKKLMGLKK